MERPILFNTEMVRAILDGRKTQTRRIMKPQPVNNNGFWHWRGAGWSDNIKKITPVYGHSMYYNSPCQPGDILWIRETWQEFMEDEVPKERNKGPSSNMGIPAKTNIKSYYYYKADGELDHLKYGKALWRPSIHMPKKAARIFLRVTGVRAEKLQDISEEDAEKEGLGDMFIDEIAHSDNPKYSLPMKRETLKIEQFELLWNSTIKKDQLDQYGWDSNPWVWVIEFERIEC